MLPSIAFHHLPNILTTILGVELGAELGLEGCLTSFLDYMTWMTDGTGRRGRARKEGERGREHPQQGNETERRCSMKRGEVEVANRVKVDWEGRFV